MVAGIPKVSVVISSYNRARLLDEAVRSVMAQDYPNLEIIIAEDGSTDGSIEVARRIAQEDTRIVPLLAPENQGMSRNYNAGLARCTGEYIAILAGDDLVLPAKISRQVEFLAQNRQYGLCSHDMEVFESPSGQVLYRFSDRWDAHSGGLEVIFDTHWRLSREIKYNLSSILGRRECMLSRPWDPRLTYWNDWLYLTECLASTGMKWGHVPEVLGRYRIHAQQLTRAALPDYFSLEEQLMVLAICQAKYPWMARLVKDKRDYVLFKHVVYGWGSPEKQADLERLFGAEAGALKWAYMKLVRFMLTSPAWMNATRPARRLAKSILGA